MSKDLKDNYGIFSRGEYSVFLWNIDKPRKIIHHPSECPIPLMLVNEGEKDAHRDFFANNPSNDDEDELISVPRVSGNTFEQKYF